MEERRRLIGFILTRILLITLLLVSTLLLKIEDPASLGSWAFGRVLFLCVATYLFSLASLVAARLFAKSSHSLAYLQIIWDILFVTVLLLVTGGVASHFSFLYLLTIISASVLLARREALYTASLCAILYGALLDLQYYGVLAPLGLSEDLARSYGTGYLLYTIFVHIAAFYLTALLTGYLAERAHRSEQALQEKAVDLDELTRLHSAIVAGMSSGLPTLNPDRKIRVFNAFAEQLTGLTQKEVYDRRLEEVLPEFVPATRKIRARSEVIMTSPERGSRILGCGTTQLFDRDGNDAGIIINFQDVTELKQMEAELQRADRLAAIGELSARIAHEIRNPLASICGSIQLIAQSGGIGGDDSRLLDIVTRESERLNCLISEFLAYARPRPPQRFPVPLRRMVDDLRLLVRSDHRFERIVIRHTFADDIMVLADIDQFTQVLWNMFTNAADAMPGGGEILVGAERLPAHPKSDAPLSWLEVSVSDNGKGMSEEEMKLVFEPFYTSKQEGTGLGLATVYRIIEGHGGHISVESVVGQGTRFLIYLPDADSAT